MRSPSARITINFVDIYPALSGPDIDGGPQYVYSPSPSVSSAACSVQYTDSGEIVDDLQRVSQVNWYIVIFVTRPAVKPRDKMVWREGTATHNLIVAANPPSEAGRSASFTVRAHEYI